MKLSKRIISSVLAVMLCFSAVGCDKKDDPKKNNLPKDVKPEPREVVETLGDFDVTDYITPNDADPNFKIEKEAEECEFTGNACVMDNKFFGDYTGDGYVTGIANLNSTIKLTYDFPSDGIYNINMKISGDDLDKNGLIIIDGVKTATFKITDTSAFADITAANIAISKGSHTIEITAETTPVHVDSFTITTAPDIDPSVYEVSNKLSNPDASDRTKRLYNFLTDAYGNYIISGNFANEAYGLGGLDSWEFRAIKTEYGDYPAIMGLDLMNLTPSAVSHGATTEVINHAIEWDAEGGIISLCWHWFAPEDYLGYNGALWNKGFYSDSTNFNLKTAMDDENSEEYKLILRDIDAIAESIKELEALDIPILWRPLHEAGGDPAWNNPWFWWGSSGAESYKKLWVLLYDRLTNYHNIDNLIWVWNGQNVDWYPGDEYVDILGYDIYAAKGYVATQKDTYDYIKGSTETNKIIALTENGVIPDPDLCMNEGTRWSWFSVWVDSYTVKDAKVSGEYTPLEIWEKVYTHDRVLTLSELPDLKNYPLDTDKFLDSQAG